MIKIFKYKNGEIRLKKDEQMLIKDYEYEWIKRQIKVKTSETLLPFLLGVEMIVHTGPRICYGMLAARVEPHNERDCVNLLLAFTQKNTVKYTGTGLLDDTHVYKGLPEEYTTEIINRSISVISQKENCPQCSIIFEDSANCEVGSSPMLFGIIAEMIINIICSGSVDEIFDFDSETFYKRYVKDVWRYS